jgi:putative membrane-bound dehydrogenase-like protein
MTRNVLVALLALLQDPQSPDDEAKRFKLDAGLRIELVASDPEVSSPVSIAFDEDGRLWVAEMLDYPNPIPGKPPLGRIRRLEDRDGDGRYEHSELFADGIMMVNGVLPWKGGAIVTAAPSILYLKDTDGDGKADVREPLYVGFAEQNPQLRVSHPSLGLDNWIYVANGQRGGKITRPGSKDAPVDIGGQDFRFDLVRGRQEAVTGFGQFGLTFDDWGQRFVCTNRNHLIHLPMANRYFARNPFLAAPPPRGDNQGLGGSAKVFPISKNKTLAASHAGTFTASCGITIYRGDLLPELYRGGAFTCEPTGNLVHLEILTQAGATFGGTPHKEGVEFLASPDPWFRPVSLANGPDGALYVVDMYRSEVEHPEWVPKDQQHRYDFNGRRDLGRIWRIVPEKHERKPSVPLGRKSTAELVALLESPNGWTRTTAHRLLFERQEGEAFEPIRKLAVSGGPLARVHAAWLLEARGKLDEAVIRELLVHAHPRVREHGAILAEAMVVEVIHSLIGLADDPDPRVRFQAALALGASKDEAALPALAKIAEKGAHDRWTRLAVASAVPYRGGELLDEIQDTVVAREIAVMVGSRRDAQEVEKVLLSLLLRPRPWQLAILNGLAEGMGRRSTQLSKSLEAVDHPVFSKKLGELVREIVAVAADPRSAGAERLDAIRFLAHVPWDQAQPALEKLLEDPAQDVRIAAVAALSAHKRPEVAPLLMKSWKTQMPAMRREVLEAMSRQPERLEFLLGEVEQGRLAGGELGPNLVRTLTNHGNAAIKARAQKALQGNLPEERQKVLDRYKAALAVKGDPKRGREVFQKNCIPCHRVAGLGTNVGPDISDTLSKTPEALLVDILDPSRVIDNNYANYLVKTKSGAVLSGFIAVQTASSLTLRRGEGQEDVVLRQDIEEMRASGVSLMPEGLEKNVSVEQFADLIAFLKYWRDIQD